MSETAIDTLEADEWIDATLSNDPAIIAIAGDRIFQDQAPQGVDAYPIIVYNMQVPRDVRFLGGATIMVEALFQIRAMVEGVSYAPLRPVTNRIHELLHDKQYVLTASGRTIVTCVREEAMRFATVEGGKHYRHLGGLYRIQISH